MTAFPSWFPFSLIFQIALLPFSALTAKRPGQFSIRTKSTANSKTRAAHRGISNLTARFSQACCCGSLMNNATPPGTSLYHPSPLGSTGIIDLSNSGSDSYREFQVAARYQVGRYVLNASYVRSRAFGDLNDFNQFFGNLVQPVIQPNARGRLPFDAPNRFLFWGTFAAPWKLTLVPVYDLHSGFPYSVENEFREYVGPRNVARFPRFSSFDLQITRPVILHFGEKHLHARVGGAVFNLFNHFDPRDVQNNIASARFGGFFNSVLA